MGARFRRTTTVALLAGLLATGCGGGGDSGTAATEAKSDAAADPLGAEAERLAALSGEEREEAAGEAAGELWDALLEETGVGEALGPDGLRELEGVLADFARGSDALAALAEERPEGVGVRGASVRGRVSAAEGRRAADGTGYASMGALMIGMMEMKLAAAGVVSASNDGKPVHGTVADGTVTYDAEQGRVSFESSHAGTSDGDQVELANRLQITACPDAEGRFEASGRIDARLTAASGVGGRAEIDITVTGRIDDDAQLVEIDIDVRVQMSDYARGESGAFLDAGIHYHGTDFSDGTGRPNKFASSDGKVNRAGGRQLDGERVTAYVGRGASVGLLLALDAVEAAKSGWESGRCVELRTTTSPARQKGLQPSTVVTITADPRSKLDGAATGGTVRASLEGQQSLDPDGSKQAAPATLTYKAPEKRDDSGTVALEARSRRGVGKASLSFDTRRPGYRASGGGNGLTVSGEVADLAEPFALQGTIIGGSLTLSYTPTSETGGSYSYEGGGSGVTVNGSGTYTITGEEGGPLTLSQTGSGCVSVGTCATGTETITLTPID